MHPRESSQLMLKRLTAMLLAVVPALAGQTSDITITNPPELRVVGPILRPFQRFIPPIGGMDITPLIAIIVLGAAQRYLIPWIFIPIIDLLHG